MPFFKIKGLSPALDGLTVEVVDSRAGGYLEVCRFINMNAIIGDRTLSFPVEKNGLLIDFSHLTAISDPEIREFSHTNPWGRCQFEGRYIKGTLEVAYAKYDLATQVTVTEKNGETSKTLFTRYCQGAPGICSADSVFNLVKETIESHLSSEGDIDDLIFSLKNLEEMY